jgi:type IV pilus assembly protein PilW
MKAVMGQFALSALCQRGVSLVELMVALVLSMILMAGVGQIYLGSKQTYRIQDGQARLQENARYALDVLNRDIRSAGYMGCRPLIPYVVPLNVSCPKGYSRGGALWCQPDPPNIIAMSPVTAPVSPVQIISGGDNNKGELDTPNPILSRSLSSGNDGVVVGTDAITVQFGASCGGVVVSGLTNKTSVTITAGNTCGTITPSKNCGAKSGCTGKVLMVANCSAVDVFRASSVTNNADGTLTLGVSTAANTSLLRGDYSIGGGEVMGVGSYTYYIRKNPGGEPSLYRFDNNANNSDEIVEGIEDMQILYGEDADADNSVDRYVVSTAVGNWAQVISVRITLMVRSVGESADNLTGKPNSPRSYDGNDKFVDSRVVKSFTSTISLSNRLQARLNVP